MKLNFICNVCNKETVKVTLFRQKEFCNTCYYDLVCQFCNPPVENEYCPGHEATGDKNRFKDDPLFVNGAKFEF